MTSWSFGFPRDTAQNPRQPPRPFRLRHSRADRLCLIGVGRRTPAGHVADVNAEHNRSTWFVPAERNRGRLPPGGMPLKEALGYASRALILESVWELLITPEYDDARPLPVAHEFVDFEADKRILSHPVDLLTQRGVAIEELSLQIDMNGNDVRLVVLGARKTSST